MGNILKQTKERLSQGWQRFVANNHLLGQQMKQLGVSGILKAIYTDLFLGRTLGEWLYLLALSAVPVIVFFYSDNRDVLGFITSLTGVINVIYVAEGRKANYIFGLITTSIYLGLALQRGFYGEVATNLYFVAMQPIGLYVWLVADLTKSNEPEQPQEFKARRRSLKGWVIAIAQTVVVWLLMGFAYKQIGAKRPFRDSVTDGTNVVGQKLMTELYVEQWLFWIATNLFSMYLWWGESLDIQVMFVLFTVNSIVGMYRWIQQAKAATA